MLGPSISCRAMSIPARRGKSIDAWQYHARSDNHSTVARWTMLFDLMRACDILRWHCEEGKIGFKVNHALAGKPPKTLDLVLWNLCSAYRNGRGRTIRFSLGYPAATLDR